MNYNRYFPGSIPVSEIGLGAWQLGQNSGWKGISVQEATTLVHKALELGINFFDTAPNYGHGSGEERLGKALKGHSREKIVINTKFGHTDKGTLDFGVNHIRQSLEGSLKRLQTDYVDSLIIHNPPTSVLDGNKNDHYEVLERLVEEGKIKAYGASVDTSEEMKLLMNTTQTTVIEAFFNILHQETANAFQLARKKGVAIIAKVPLDSGWLTGKYHAKSTFNDIRSRWSRQDIELRAQLIEKIKKIIGSGENLSQKAIAFCSAYEAVSTVIPGCVNKAQLKSNVESVNQPIASDVLEALERLYDSEIAALKLPW